MFSGHRQQSVDEQKGSITNLNVTVVIIGVRTAVVEGTDNM